MPDASSVYRYFRLLSMLRRMHAPLTVITRLPSINCKMEAGSMPMRWPSMSEGRCVNQRDSRPNRYNGRQRIVTMDFIDLDRRFVRLRKDRPADLDLGHWGRLYGSTSWTSLLEHSRVVILAEHAITIAQEPLSPVTSDRPHSREGAAANVHFSVA